MSNWEKFCNFFKFKNLPQFLKCIISLIEKLSKLKSKDMVYIKICVFFGSKVVETKSISIGYCQYTYYIYLVLNMLNVRHVLYVYLIPLLYHNCSFQVWLLCFSFLESVFVLRTYVPKYFKWTVRVTCNHLSDDSETMDKPVSVQLLIYGENNVTNCRMLVINLEGKNTMLTVLFFFLFFGLDNFF